MEEDGLSSINDSSETSSITDEREIHLKLRQILHILNEKNPPHDDSFDLDRMSLVQEVYDEASTEEMQVYLL